ncbi:hypothetical protein KFL_000790040 [Klebsormidium nitens]|uniref:Mitochondrial transcription termination factor n=1 Tax=Klebsormidium nitens TaxID=105231 RepID=A0A1Y1HW06_KLENI|nr:hypothetical protein KFL_000790040 [Klebsormidium nitens]|eukprot:GAQ81379.1 hypothetical protein KFL_000790040 [Klebsormidium nitens]
MALSKLHYGHLPVVSPPSCPCSNVYTKTRASWNVFAQFPVTTPGLLCILKSCSKDESTLVVEHQRGLHWGQRSWCAAAGRLAGDTAVLVDTRETDGSLQELQLPHIDDGTPESDPFKKGQSRGRGSLKEAWERKRALRQSLREAGVQAAPTEKLLRSTRRVGDHARARLQFWELEGPHVGAGGGAAVEGHPWLLTCDYHEMLAIRGCLLAHGVSLRRNAKLLKYALEHGPNNVERLLLLLEELGVSDITRVVHTYPRLLGLRSEDVAAKVAFLRDLGLDACRLGQLFQSQPRFIYPSLATMQSKVAFLVSMGFSQAQAAVVISRYPLALGCDLHSHFPRIQQLFEEYGFSHADFLYVVERSPGVLLSRVDANLRPKLAFFRARGLSPLQLVAMVKAYPTLLGKNLHSALQPKVEYLVGPMERDISELVVYAAVLGYSMARLRRRQEAVAQYGITCSLSTMLSRTDAQFAQFIARVSRQTYEAKMAGVRRVHQQQQQQQPQRRSALDRVALADFELPVYKMHRGDGQLKWPAR